MQEVHVVTSFLVHEDKILLLRRSQQVGSYQQRWAGISGYLEEGRTPLQQARIEIEEESSLSVDDINLLKEGLPLEVADESLDRVWVVHPFRFAVAQADKIKIDWEHSEYKWVNPSNIPEHTCVPGLFEAWQRVE
jgi:ADP-ribose pyrophosphatase YjhB (NUDIX family)